MPEITITVTRFRLARQRAGLTLAQVAERSGLDIGTVSRIERGTIRTRSRPATVERLARAYGCSVDELTGHTSSGRHGSLHEAFGDN